MYSPTNIKATSPLEKWTEDLLWQAARGMELGRDLCTCPESYHALWGTLRARGNRRGLKSDEPIIASILSPFVTDQTRVLIAGCADPGVLCGIGRIVEPRQPRITILDKCKAPLALIEEFAAVKGIRCETRHLDILDLDGSNKWDLIFLHYTLGFVDPHSRNRLFRQLANSLAPSGTLVCVERTGRLKDCDQAAARDAYLADDKRALQDTSVADILGPTALNDVLCRYAAARTARRLVLPTEKEILEALEDAKLAISAKIDTNRGQALDINSMIGIEQRSSMIFVAAKRSA